MMSNLIVSVPHTGTRFLKERLSIEDHIHTYEPWSILVERTRDRHLIVPLRRPASVWRSWCRRNEHGKFPYAEFFMAWGYLHALDQIRDLDTICIDKCEDSRITDWSPIGSGDGSRANWKLLKIDLQQLDKLPIVSRNYGGLI